MDCGSYQGGIWKIPALPLTCAGAYLPNNKITVNIDYVPTIPKSLMRQTSVAFYFNFKLIFQDKSYSTHFTNVEIEVKKNGVSHAERQCMSMAQAALKPRSQASKNLLFLTIP